MTDRNPRADTAADRTAEQVCQEATARFVRANEFIQALRPDLARLYCTPEWDWLEQTNAR